LKKTDIVKHMLAEYKKNQFKPRSFSCDLCRCRKQTDF